MARDKRKKEKEEGKEETVLSEIQRVNRKKDNSQRCQIKKKKSRKRK